MRAYLSVEFRRDCQPVFILDFGRKEYVIEMDNYNIIVRNIEKWTPTDKDTYYKSVEP